LRLISAQPFKETAASLLDNPRGNGNKARLLDFPPMGIGERPIIADHDLPLVGDMGGHLGDELQSFSPGAISTAPRSPHTPLFPITPFYWHLFADVRNTRYPSTNPLPIPATPPISKLYGSQEWPELIPLKWFKSGGKSKSLKISL